MYAALICISLCDVLLVLLEQECKAVFIILVTRQYCNIGLLLAYSITTRGTKPILQGDFEDLLEPLQTPVYYKNLPES